MWVAGRFGSTLSSHLATGYINFCSLAIASDAALTLKLLAVKAVECFLTSVSKDLFVNFVEKIVTGIIVLMRSCKDEVLILFLETLQFAISVDVQVTSKLITEMSNSLCAVWMQREHDLMVMELLQDLFKSLGSNPLCSAVFQANMYPLLLNSLRPDVWEKNPTSIAVP